MTPRRPIRRAVAGLVLAACLLPAMVAATTTPGTASGDAAATPAPALEGDRERLRQVMLEARVATDRSRPSVGLWARDAGTAFSRWMSEWMERMLPGFARVAMPFVEPAMMILVALLATILLVFLSRLALDRWRRRLPDSIPDVEPLTATAAAKVTARDWGDELRRGLASGDVAASIEALWWWLAGRLVADRAEPSWTSRELVTRADRRDLLASVRRLDRMMYGAGQPSADEVGRLWNDLEEALG